MDNSEDNCVENKQLLENQVPQWIETWSKYILTQYSTASEPNAEAMVIAQEILLAITQGDSCISAKGRDTSSFQSLMIKDTQINRLDDHAQVAPFVEDDQFLYTQANQPHCNMLYLTNDTPFDIPADHLILSVNAGI